MDCFDKTQEMQFFHSEGLILMHMITTGCNDSVYHANYYVMIHFEAVQISFATIITIPEVYSIDG